MGWRQWIHQPSPGRRGLASLVAAGALALAGVATSVPASAGISDTKHNLGTSANSNPLAVNKFSGTTEICVFCHTPHGAETAAVVPLWNRSAPVQTTYQTYDSTGTGSMTLDGKVAVSVGSISIACLSCHDGVTSMSTVINAPGSGLAGNAAWQAGLWAGANNTGGGLAGGLMTGIAAVGPDLRNDHPIGIQYGGGGVSSVAKTPSTTTDPDFKIPTYGSIGGKDVWWVDTTAGGSATRQKTDMILYTRAAGTYTAQANPEPFVECGSCHDPHSSNSTFLRIENTGSAVCLACHIK